MYVIAGPDTKEKDHMHLTFYPNPGESLTNQVKKVKLRLRKYLKDEKGINITFRRSYGFKGGGMGTLQRLVAYIKQNIDAGKNKKVVNDLNEILSQEIS